VKLGKYFRFCRNNFIIIAATTKEQSFVRIYLGTKHIIYIIQQSFLSPNMLCIYALVPLWPSSSLALHLRMNKHDNIVLGGNLTQVICSPCRNKYEHTNIWYAVYICCYNAISFSRTLSCEKKLQWKHSSKL